MHRLMLFAAAAAAGTAATAQDAGSRKAREYVAAASQSDRFEVLEAQTALTGSADLRVLAFARRMIAEHDGTGNALRDAAARAGLKPPPPGISAEQGQMLGALQSVRGPDFDKVYWHQQALSHRSALTTTQGYASGGDVPALRQAAAAAAPVIAAHLAMAEQMAARAGS